MTHDVPDRIHIQCVGGPGKNNTYMLNSFRCRHLSCCPSLFSQVARFYDGALFRRISVCHSGHMGSQARQPDCLFGCVFNCDPYLGPWFPIDFHWFPLVSHWFPIDFPLISHWFPIDFPWAAHDSSILWTRGESFWEVAPDLADSPAAAWAMSLAFPPELKPLFVECFGVREAPGLRHGIRHGAKGGRRRTGKRSMGQ